MTHFCCEIICCCCWITDWFTCEIVTMAGTEGETRSLQPTLFVILCVFEVVLLFWGCWMLCWWGEFVCFVLFLRCCLGFLRSSLWRTIYISTLMDSLHRSKCHILGITTSSPWELPHRVVHLNKGEGKMVFQHRGYGFYVCVGLVLSEVLEEEFVFWWDLFGRLLHPGWSFVLCCVIY